MEDSSNSVNQLIALMEALPFVSWFKDKEGRFTRVNSILLNSLQKDAEEVIGRTSREVFGRVEAKHDEEGDLEVLDQGRVSRATYSRNQRIFQSVRFPVFGVKGQVEGTGGYQEDITNLARSLSDLHM